MCDTCGWEEVLERIEGLEESGEYGWAEDTLFGIAVWIEDHEHVTEGQVEAIANIEEAGR